MRDISIIRALVRSSGCPRISVTPRLKRSRSAVTFDSNSSSISSGFSASASLGGGFWGVNCSAWASTSSGGGPSGPAEVQFAVVLMWEFRATRTTTPTTRIDPKTQGKARNCRGGLGRRTTVFGAISGIGGGSYDAIGRGCADPAFRRSGALEGLGKTITLESSSTVISGPGERTSGASSDRDEVPFSTGLSSLERSAMGGSGSVSISAGSSWGFSGAGEGVLAASPPTHSVLSAQIVSGSSSPRVSQTSQASAAKDAFSSGKDSAFRKRFSPSLRRRSSPATSPI